MNDLGIHNLWLFIFAGWALALTPGPDVFYMITSTLRGGFRAGLLGQPAHGHSATRLGVVRTRSRGTLCGLWYQAGFERGMNP
jgi:hypothetical protein